MESKIYQHNFILKGKNEEGKLYWQCEFCGREKYDAIFLWELCPEKTKKELPEGNSAKI